MSNVWYARYPGDYGRDTAHLPMIEHGAYGLLLDHYYSTGAPLPADIAALHRICRAFTESERVAVDSVIRQFFTLQADGYHNARADVELVRRTDAHEKLSKSGRRGAQKRWSADGLANGQANGPAIARPQPQSQPQKEKRKSAATPPADARYGPFLELAKASFEGKYGHPPTWDCFGKDGAALAAFLRRAPHVTLEVWTAHLSAYFDSTEPFTVKQGGSLSYFVSKFDAFEHGPIQGGNNGNRNNAAVKPEAGKYSNIKPIRATA